MGQCVSKAGEEVSFSCEETGAADPNKPSSILNFKQTVRNMSMSKARHTNTFAPVPGDVSVRILATRYKNTAGSKVTTELKFVSYSTSLF